jgi:hypothetical protein
VKPSAIVAAIGMRTFYRGLTGQQKTDLDAEIDTEWQAKQPGAVAAQ